MLNQFFPSLITFLLTIITLCSPLKEKSFPKRLQDQTNVTVQSQLNFPTSENLRNHLHNIPGQPVTIIKPYIPSAEFPNPITLISQHFHNERNPRFQVTRVQKLPFTESVKPSLDLSRISRVEEKIGIDNERKSRELSERTNEPFCRTSTI